MTQFCIWLVIFAGVFNTNFKLDYPIKDGNWTIRVHAFVSTVLFPSSMLPLFSAQNYHFGILVL